MVKSERNSRPITLLRTLVRAYQTTKGHDSSLVAKLGISASEFDIIATLGNTDGLRMCDLASKTLMSAPNITRVVKKLEESRLVERTRAVTSDREVLARLTPAGERVFDESYPVVVDGVRAFFDAHLDADEQEQLIELLQKLLDCPREKAMLAALLS